MLALAVLATVAAVVPGPAARAGEATHAIAMHGAPALPPDFPHFRYADPEAPKGGRLTLGVLGTFDSLNPFVVRGLPVQMVRGHVIESLLTRGYDEPFTLYGLLASRVETDPARSFVTFGIDPDAAFADGAPVTAEDVIFSWRLLRDHGRPNYRTYYAKVAKAEALGPRTVRFDLAGADDRELPLILGLMPILPRHAVDPERFEETTLEPPLGSGPYVVAAVDAGRSVTLARNPRYWGRDRAVNRGLWNFDTIRLDWYRDDAAYFEAFRKGLYDLRAETDPGRWETGYDFPAAREGRVVREEFPTGLPRGMAAFVFNTRRPVFSDIRVREAVVRLFDFEWINTNLFFGRYRRTGSFFEGSELSHRGRPADAAERALLAPFPDAVRPDVMAGTDAPPVTDGSGRDRATLKAALDLLGAAGFRLDGGVLRHTATGQPLAFEILVTSKDQERLALAFARTLERAGIAPAIRMVDAVQFEQRRIQFDFDMIPNRWEQSLSPGNEQAFYWGSAAADEPGSRNYMGVRSPAVDAMIAAVLRARTREDLVSAVRALDRVLVSGVYVVPLYHLPTQWVARWSEVRHPAATSLYGWLPETWWRAGGR
ncbi:extracellular solute-binding protein [Rhodoplanes sp. TEM]|uniref:Extracellular solute-binding protein n=1 Tax=Rhodoplanes tepidamans TaxID=200616 RepID=A0ABT5JI15_RHOTP|nr:MULTISPECIES: extracellular solute-binding protein [Rhodoplanes]MDC7789237.1 extracellular solute-binding protein [Rhodoplanes tepidamans]MDC7985825.1 extracellular solute-binding protein [Rhodoplanes sp. TEM]MDQ0358848.1 peptide/nickel transport system substrate-binding protein [Rhodoplanes tepidamans]